MFTEWHESPAFPGTRIKCRPLDGIRLLDIAIARARNNHALDGKSAYAACEFAIVDWEHAPLLRGKFSEKYDPAAIASLEPGLVAWLASTLETEAYLSEVEAKNSDSQST